MTSIPMTDARPVMVRGKPDEADHRDHEEGRDHQEYAIKTGSQHSFLLTTHVMPPTQNLLQRPHALELRGHAR